ncbi:glucose-6-phosphate acetlytransferase 1 (GNPNAT1) [Vairimorpha necatrix]|uniref:Glucosamine 6-phosphate N-acetyltransferase n=1 Tax=Vairimorpha necatrix TaxID=6039 RepID=A0AAX4J8K2_9MICR
MKENYTLRELKLEDYDAGYITCINELTTPVEIDKETFTQRLDLLKNKKDYHVVVAQDSTGRILGSGTIFLEYKFIRGCSVKGHIEDIVVLKEKRGLGIGKRIIEHLLDYGKRKECYKIALVCEEKNKKFYEKCGFKEKEREMVIYTQ